MRSRVKGQNRLTLEAVPAKVVYALVAISVVVFFLEVWINVKVTGYTPYLRGLAEEGIRLLFVYGAFRAVRLISTPSIILAITAFVFATVVNFLFFRPNYLTSISFAFVIAMANVLSLTIFGFTAGMIYLRSYLRTQTIFWGFIILVPVKISFYLFYQWLANARMAPLPESAAAVFVLGLFAAVAVAIYRRNAADILRERTV